MTAMPEYEELAWPALVGWWPHRPLLRAAAAPAGTEQRALAFSRGGGSKGDARARESAAVVVYQTPQATVSSTDAIGVVMAGGYVLSHYLAANPEAVPPPDSATTIEAGPGSAKQWTMDLGHGTSVRCTRWDRNGLAIVLFTSATARSDDDVRRFADSLRAA